MALRILEETRADIMEQVKNALEATSLHGLPRVASNKPIYIRILWLLLFLFMLSLFLKGFIEFINKLQSHQVTTSFEANSLPFQFPDVYACYENALSGSYASNVDSKSAQLINDKLLNASSVLKSFLMQRNLSSTEMLAKERELSFFYPQSLPFKLLVDSLSHRIEQGVLSSGIVFMESGGSPDYTNVHATVFYHPLYLQCFKWSLDRATQKKLAKSGLSTGLAVTLLIDGNSTEVTSGGTKILPMVYTVGEEAALPVSDWTMLSNDFFGPDRTSGVRVFLTPPGEYPSDFVNSFSLSPGMHHKVEISMTQQEYKAGQFNCRAETPAVQFVNPYDQTPYNHIYSFSYCYYYEYHKQFQALFNLSGDVSPLPWPLVGKKYLLNVTGEPNFLAMSLDPLSDFSAVEDAYEVAQDKCGSQRPCTTRDYKVSISSSDWPSQSSLMPFIQSTVRQAWLRAKSKNQSVPALDFLLTGNSSSVTSYVRQNMLKANFKPRSALSDKVTFSKDYGISNFISDVGGIMGIYLGMSLLTLCELIELFYDLITAWNTQRRPKTVEPDQTMCKEPTFVESSQ